MLAANCFVAVRYHFRGGGRIGEYVRLRRSDPCSGRVLTCERGTGLSRAAERFAHDLTELVLCLRDAQSVVRLWDDEDEEGEHGKAGLSADACGVRNWA